MSALYGMLALRGLNMFIGCGQDVLFMVLDGLARGIVWPQRYRCERAPSGHMMLVMSHWNRYPGKEENNRKAREFNATALVAQKARL